jgi:cob(I)alamin adenosyltransferase
MDSFFTREGDDGYTGLLGEGRFSKADLRLETLGSLDETNAALGLARACAATEQVRSILLQVQRDLYWVMAEVASSPGNSARFNHIGQQQVEWLEEQVTVVSRQVVMPEGFIIPGDSLSAAAMDLARTAVRRAERRMADLVQRGWVNNPHLLEYLNRLSSLCFAAELFENAQAGRDNPTLIKD